MLTIADFKEVLLLHLGRLLLVGGILVITIAVARIASLLLKRSIHKSSEKIKVDPTRYNFLRHAISALIYVIGISFAIYSVPSLRTIGLSIFAGAGLLAVVIGFASQQAFSNIIAGVFIVIFKPFSLGDKLKVGKDIYGVVEDISLRHTVIRNWENKRLIIPNSVISNETIENWDANDPKICKWLDIGISYDSDIDKALHIMQDEAMKHPNFIDNRTDEEKNENKPAVTARVIGFGDSSVNLRAYVWAKDSGAAFSMGCDLNKSIKQRFDREGIEIPFPYRTVVYKKDIESQAKKLKPRRKTSATSPRKKKTKRAKKR